MREYQHLPKAAPEEMGVPSGAILRFINRLEEKELPMHGVMMLRHGKVIGEYYWAPFTNDRKHRMYSTSKSFVAVAVGLLQEEGLLSIDDPFVKYFPEHDTPDLHPYLRATTIRHLLMMACPWSCVGVSYSPKDPDWEKAIFEKVPDHLPGKIFRYDTTAPTLLCMIIKKLTGKQLTEYLRDKLFIPTGMHDDIWCVKTPCGYDWGGSGIQCTLEDLARFALVCMSGGKWEGKQVLPEAYIREATSKQIDNSFENAVAHSRAGYGYQFWMLEDGGFKCSGMGAQFAFCWPKEDFVLLTIGDTQFNQMGGAIIEETCRQFIFPYLAKDEPVSVIAEDAAALANRAENLRLFVTKGDTKNVQKEALVHGRTYKMWPNTNNGWKSAQFLFEDGKVRILYENATGSHELVCGMGYNFHQPFPENSYFGEQIGVPAGRGLDSYASAAWAQDGSLQVTVYITDYCFGTLRMQIAFEDDTMSMFGNKNAEWFLDDFWGFAAGQAID